MFRNRTTEIMAARSERQAVSSFSRSLKAKHERRQRLRIRIPQVQNVVDGSPVSDSDSGIEDDTDGIESDSDSDNGVAGSQDDSDSDDGAGAVLGDSDSEDETLEARDDDDSEVETENIDESDDSGNESDDEEGSEAEPINQPQPSVPAAQPSAPGFITLVPPASPSRISQQPSEPSRVVNPPAQSASEINNGPRTTIFPSIDDPVATDEPSVTSEPSRPVGPPESVVNSRPDPEPTTFVSSRIVTRPANLPESSARPVEEDAESLISDTSLLASTTAEPTSTPSEPAEQIGATEGGTSINRGTDVGIILGTMALATVLIAACVFFYRRRKTANADHNARMDEKPTSTPYNGPDTAVGNDRLQLNSWARFTKPNGEGGGQGVASYYGGTQKAGQFVAPESPVVPHTPNGAAGAFRSLTGQEPPPQMTSRYGGGPVAGRLVPPPANLAPPPRAEIYPPGQVPIPPTRARSMARTETTESTEGTWRTWGVDQGRPGGNGNSQRQL